MGNAKQSSVMFGMKTKQSLTRFKRPVLLLLPIVAMIVPILILYSLYPETFQNAWKGRLYYFFFIWLLCLEGILGTDRIVTKRRKLKSLTTIFLIVALAVALALPTVYVIAANYYGLSQTIIDFSQQHGIYFSNEMALSAEYLSLTVFFALIIGLAYGLSSMGIFSISTLFLGAIGGIFTIDNMFPFGRFTPFQFLVPTTTQLSAKLLNAMGYQTVVSFVTNNPTYGSMPYLYVKDAIGRHAAAGVAWPCSGIESLIIYTVVILLFLKSSSISFRLKAAFFVLGALVTYMINVARIATIFVIAINSGGITSQAATDFHNIYGQFYSVSWILSYPLIIIGIQLLSNKYHNHRMNKVGSQNGN